MQLKYNIEDRPPLGEMLLYGLQWLAICIPSIVIVGKAIPSPGIAGGEVFYLQKLFAVVGFTLLVQIFFGHRLPLILGPSTVLLIGLLSSLDRSQGVINSAMLLGGLLLTIMAATGLFAYIKSFFTPRVIVVVMILIAFTLQPTIINLVTSSLEVNSNYNLGFSAVIFIILVLGNRFLAGIWKSTLALWAMLLGSLFYYGIFQIPMKNVAILAPVSLPPFSVDLGLPDPGIILAFLICYVALSMNELSSIQSVAMVLDADNAETRINRGLLGIGFGNIIAALGGVVGPVDFSLGPGVIASTGCASRFTLVPTGLALLALACSPLAIAMVGSVPPAVIGVVLAYIITSQIGAAVMIIHQTQSGVSMENGLVLGLPLMLGTMTAFLPAEVITQFPAMIRPVLANGFVIGLLTVLFLEHFVYTDT